MAKGIDSSKEPARKTAERKWRNHALVKRYKEGKLPFVAIVDPDDVDYEKRKVHLKTDEQAKATEPGHLSTNDEKLKGPLVKFETRFKKEIMALLNEHTGRNLALYAASLKHQKYVLLKEKLRRLEAQQEVSK
jgi:hypothetical protein